MTSHPEIAGARCECPACRIERIESELAESKRVNAKLNEEHRDLAEKLAAAKAKIKAVCDACEGWEVHSGHGENVLWVEVANINDALESATPKPTDNSEDAT